MNAFIQKRKIFHLIMRYYLRFLSLASNVNMCMFVILLGFLYQKFVEGPPIFFPLMAVVRLVDTENFIKTKEKLSINVQPIYIEFSYFLFIWYKPIFSQYFFMFSSSTFYRRVIFYCFL